MQELLNRTRNFNLTPTAASFAARLQIAGHVEDQTAAEYKAQHGAVGGSGTRQVCKNARLAGRTTVPDRSVERRFP